MNPAITSSRFLPILCVVGQQGLIWAGAPFQIYEPQKLFGVSVRGFNIKPNEGN